MVIGRAAGLKSVIYFQGKTYGIWKLSDLGSTTANDLVAFFLFGDVYKEHWKTSEGTVVALLNPSILPGKDVSINLTFLLPCFSVQIKQKNCKNMNSVQQQCEHHH